MYIKIYSIKMGKDITNVAIFGFGTLIGVISTHLIFKFLKNGPLREEQFKQREPKQNFRLMLGVRTDAAVDVADRRILALSAEGVLLAYQRVLRDYPDSIYWWFRNGWKIVAVETYVPPDFINLFGNASEHDLRTFMMADDLPEKDVTLRYAVIVIGPASKKIADEVFGPRYLY